jgi:hypothetical protein
MAATTDCGFEILTHPGYSPDLPLSDFYLFPKLKTKLHGRHFGSNEGAMEQSMSSLRTTIERPK